MTVVAMLLMVVLAFVQNISFSMVSRSRNRDHYGYHLLCAVMSNGVWFATSKYLIVANSMTWALMLPYTLGTVAGSLTGSKISAYIEKKIGA